MNTRVKITPRIAAPVARRLRLGASLRSRSMSAGVNDVLDEAPPGCGGVRRQAGGPAAGGRGGGRGVGGGRAGGAAGQGWGAGALWIVPAAIYALASDTLIGVVRAQAVARLRADNAGLGDDAPDLLATLGGTALWLLRLLLAGPSTLRGFRAWVIEGCPVAPGPQAAL